MTPAMLRADAEAAMAGAVGWSRTWEAFQDEDDDEPCILVTDEEGDRTKLDFREDYGWLLAVRIAAMHEREPRLARAALALAELMPHLERLEAAASLPPEIDEAAVAEAEQYAIASLVFAFNAIKESLR